MVFHKKDKTALQQQGISFKKSMLAMCIMALSSPTWAQDATESEKTTGNDVEEVVVTGMRQALSSAQDIKQNADTVVDSITAKDFGSFPDKSVGEALQRVAGITVNRFAASSDTAHFSAEPSGVIVRGLNQVRSEFNGRDSFSANSGRGLSWGDVSPELMSGVDTYKNQTAELIEGGIAGTINLRTRLPFDQSGELKALTLSTNYGDLADSYTPEGSALYSNRWETSAGEFGAMVNVAYSEVETRSQGIQLNRMNRFRDVYGEDTLRYIPDGVNFRDNLYERERNGVALALQWQDTDQVYVASLQFNRSEYENSWEEYVIGPNMGNASFGQSVFYEIKDGSEKIPIPAAGTGDFTWDNNDVFQTGTLTMPFGGWNAGAGVYKNDQGVDFITPCYDWNGCAAPRNIGAGVTSSTRAATNKNMTQDLGFNLKWNPTDTIHAQFDVQYVDSTVEAYDIEMGMNTYSNAEVDLTGSLPSVELQEPAHVNWSANGMANPHNYWVNSIMDHVEDSSGDEFAFKADVKFDVESGWVESVKVGARYADRDQQVNWSNYNWQNVSNSWSANPESFFVDSGPSGTFKGYPDFTTVKQWDSSFGDISTSDGMNTFVVGNADLMKNQRAFANAMSATALGLTDGRGWDPICSNVGDRNGEVDGTCFTPAETADISEETQALYVQMHFGGENLVLFDRPLTGNIGVRYVKTELTSVGGNDYKALGADSLVCEPNEGENGQVPAVPNTVGCYLSADDKAFMNGFSEPTIAEVTHHNVLPSLNLKYELDEGLQLRVALSRAMARPDVGNLRNYAAISNKLPSTSDASDPLWIKNSNGEITGAKVFYSTDKQNPYLKPIIADQADISVEYYFDSVGSVTFTGFTKHFDDYIQHGRTYTDYTNNGVTRTVEVGRPFNGDGAKINGFEFAFQRFFDFFPAPFDGLGVQANYTYIDNQGISNANVKSTSGDGTSSTVSGQAPDTVKVDRLEGMSDESYNIVLMYEKDAIKARLAYNWRSEFMVTAIDCCVAMPIWNESAGYLDGSVSYDFNDNVQVSFQASNLLNTETVLKQQVSDYDKGGLQLDNAWFQNDRRYTLSLRLKY
ncbi:MAG TPA: TonB-dependent receptor [Cellvibrio sp.]|nr:TonB-dependent receptor [Cellvibrio sp.]